MRAIPPVLAVFLAVTSIPASPVASIQVARAQSGAPDVSKAKPSSRFSNLRTAEEPSFRRHVVPLMSRLGCSGRECHGSFQGRGGFQLSLFGYDFDTDHAQITKNDNGDEGGVRVSLADPTKSLLLQKGAALMKHKGKERFAKDSWEYNLFLKWISGGAKLDVAETGDFERLEVFPKEIVFRKPGESVQLRVMAHWKDGTVEDVTEITRFRSNDDAVASVSDTGKIESKGRGDSHVVAFYDNGVMPIPVMLPVSDAAKYPKIPGSDRTRVDALVNSKLKKAGIVPSELCTDPEFLRRASLDVTGTLPPPSEIEAFIADQTPGKRDRKIQELLARPGYAAWWTTKLCDFTGNNPAVLRGSNLAAESGQHNYGPQLARQWFDWVYTRVEKNAPYDELAAGIVLGSMRSDPTQTYGEFVEEMARYFKKVDAEPFGKRETMPWFWARQNVAKAEDKALAFAHTFLGVRIECAQCHKHPFDQWTKQDFAQFQAFFTTIAFRQPDGKKADDAGSKELAEKIRDEIRVEAKKRVDADFLAKDLKKAQEAREAKRKAETEQASAIAATAPAPAQNAQAPAGAVQALAGAAQAAADPAAAQVAPEPLEPLPMTDVEKARRAADLKVAYQRAGEKILAERIRDGVPLAWADLSATTPKSVKAAKPQPVPGAVSGSSRVMTPKLLGGEQVMMDTYDDVRKPLMDWLRAKENSYFAKAWVNRVWANYFGRGLVEPADDLNLANAPSNSELFDYLAKGFVDHGFDMKWLHHEILSSDAYQRSWQTNATNKTDEKNFSHALIRRLPAELVYDAIMMATETAERNEKYPLMVEERAIGATGTTNYTASTKGSPSADSYALTIFGKPARQTNCDCERVTDPTLLQTIYTRNDPAILARIDNKRGTAWVESSLGLTSPNKNAVNAAPQLDPQNLEKFIRETYLRTVSRLPTAAEVERAKGDVLASNSPVDGARELLWTLLNTREFLVNH
jgi:hypothetical protein